MVHSTYGSPVPCEQSDRTVSCQRSVRSNFGPVENSSWAVLLNETEVYFALTQKALISLDPQLNFV